VSRLVAAAPLLVAALLFLAVGVATWRKLRRSDRGLAVWLQWPAAVLLYLTLFPPVIGLRSDALTVLPAGASTAQRAAPADQPIVALPGATAPARAEFVPDLGTALRRHPEVSQLMVIGAGLTARDREAVGSRVVQFAPAPEHGLVELQAPTQVPLGRQWSLSGRALPPVRRVELRDPSGAVVDAVDVDANGRFSLSASARGPGAVRFELRLQGAEHAPLESVSVPVIVSDGGSLAVILRYGAINPELKYWRRWAADAGFTASVAAGLTEGISLHEGDAQLTPAALSKADLVIIDARGWAGLDAAEKAALQAAITQGLGLLLRADGALAPETAADWRALGFAVSATPSPVSVTLDRRLGLRDRSPFTLAPVAVDAGASTVQLQADDGTPLAWWHAEGAGRVGLWRLIDSYRLMLLGEPERYANLWATTLDLLARPRASPPPAPTLPVNAWVDERAVLCGLGAAASVRPPNGGTAVPLVVNGQACAGFWPAVPGWHVLQTGAASWPFYVRAADDGRSLRTALNVRATAAMAAPLGLAAAADSAVNGDLTPAPLHRPMARWPWFLGWLALSAVLWWLERRSGSLSP
jgi:hypothetical protein